MMSTKSHWQSGKFSLYDGYETVLPVSPVVFYDDFCGAYFRKYITDENTTAPWSTVETDINLAPLLVANAVNGIIQLTLDTDDISQQAAVYFGDQLSLSMKQGLIFETRLLLPVLPASGGGEDSQAVWGLASATGLDLDAIGTNAWFKVESAANTALLWETDDGNTDDNDNAAGVVLTNAAWHIYRIDCQDLLTGVKFYVDGALVGTSADFLTNLTDSEAKVQPYLCVTKTKTAANTAVGTMYVDYVRIWMNRSA
jgi:hypothetical protein